MSTALANARDLGDWLGIKGYAGLYNFHPSVRPVNIEIHIQGFEGKHYCPRMQKMNKPAYESILTHSPNKPVLVFVSSRRQTRLTATELIQYASFNDSPKQFLHMPQPQLQLVLKKVKDKTLRDSLEFGVAIHHAGLSLSDRTLVEQLFAQEKIQVLISTATLAWGVNLPAHLVVIKGCEFFDPKTKSYKPYNITDLLQMMGRAGRPQFDKSGVITFYLFYLFYFIYF